jgi:hypothetical protein
LRWLVIRSQKREDTTQWFCTMTMSFQEYFFWIPSLKKHDHASERLINSFGFAEMAV